MANAKRDDNRITALLAKSNASDALIELLADAVTQRLLVNSTITGTVDIDGTIRIQPYKLTDEDSASDPAYYGYVDKDENWFILKITDSAGSYRYRAGSSGYTTAWTNRATGSAYQYYYEVF